MSNRPPPMPVARRVAILATIGAVCAVALGACVLARVVGVDRLRGNRVYDRAAFEKEFMGASPEMVQTRLGKPDRTFHMVETGVCWLYKGRTRDADGVIDDRVSLCFNHRDRVYLISPVKKPGAD